MSNDRPRHSHPLPDHHSGDPLPEESNRMNALWLPFPNWKLSTNGRRRLHWAQEHKLVRKAREDALFQLIRTKPKSSPYGRLALTWTATPPDKRNRDDDNFLSAVKPYRDEIAEWIGINDGEFITQPVIWEPPKGKEFACVTVAWRSME